MLRERLSIGKTKQKKRKEKLERFLNERLPECKTDWEDFKLLLQEAADHAFGKRKVVSNDSFEDQDEEIQKLLKDKKLNRNSLRERIRAMKKMLFQKKAEQQSNIHTKRTIANFMPHQMKCMVLKLNSHTLRSKGGVLLTASEEIKERWVEHFSELLNHRTEVDLSIVEDIEQYPINDSLDDPIIETELDQALKNTKLGKALVQMEWYQKSLCQEADFVTYTG